MLPKRGRPGQVFLFEVERELTPDDLLRLATDQTIEKVGPPAIQKLRANHHAVARHLASGKTVVETAELCGLTPQRVGDLQRTDPAFKELLAYYRDQVDVAGIDEAKETLGDFRFIGRATREELKRRVSDPALVAQMDVDQLRRLTEMSADRTDAPPRTAQNVTPPPTHITFNMGPRDIRQKAESKIIDHEPGPAPVVLEIEHDDDKGS